MAAYVRMEALEKRGISLPTHTWQQQYPVPGVGIPRQTDGHNCGVYAIVFAQCLTAGFPLQSCGISEATAVAARAHIAYDLMQVGCVPGAALSGASLDYITLPNWQCPH
jgi:Ulp1 family protease